MFCKHCGCEILNDSLFCENCGAKVENAPSAPQPAAPVQTAAPASPVQAAAPAAAPVAAPAASQFQAVPVTPVYPPNSVYARNAYEALQAQQAMMQQPQLMQTPQQYAPVQQPYATVTPLQQYPSPVYTQPLPGVLYDPNAAPAGSSVFLKILRIAGGVTSGIYTLLFLLSLVSSSADSGKPVGYFLALSYSVFVLIFSLCRKKIGKGAFIALIIPLGIMLYLVSSVATNN